MTKPTSVQETLFGVVRQSGLTQTALAEVADVPQSRLSQRPGGNGALGAVNLSKLLCYFKVKLACTLKPAP